MVAGLFGLAACTRPVECDLVAPREQLVMTVPADVVGRASSVRSVCVDDRCFGPAVAITQGEARPVLSDAPGAVVLEVVTGQLPETEAADVLVTLTDARVLRGRVGAPIVAYPDGKGCLKGRKSRSATLV